MKEKFTTLLWQEIGDIYEAILDLPFIRELTGGGLPLELFQFYMQQDSLYLDDFARALAITGTRASEPDELQSFLEFATGAIVTEKALHESYFVKYGVESEGRKSPACFSYTNFLLAAAYHKTYPESVAALLPCFWIYRDVGHHIHDQADLADHPYRDWIETYAGTEFGEAVDRAIEITDRVAERVSEAERESMVEQFVLSSRLEWMFWDSAYTMEEWRP